MEISSQAVRLSKIDHRGALISRILPIPLLKAFVSVVLLVAAIVFVSRYYHTSEILNDFRALSVAGIAAVFAALITNALAAVVRFKILADEIEHPITFRQAMAAVSVGSLAGALFFQIAGQLMARGVVAGRAGMPFAAVVVITAYERFTAAIVLALLALGGAFFIFGRVYLDESSGGADLIKITAGLIAATTAGALIGYGRKATQAVTPIMTRHFALRCLGIVGLTLLVHLPMQAAYVIAAHTLSPQTSVYNLIAASAIVMFATSVPISLAGWGMREMSAVVGLGAIGVAGHSALTAAIMVGVGSLIVVAFFALISLPEFRSGRQSVRQSTGQTIDYYHVLEWVLPLGAATLVLFQIYVPVRSGLLNVNLADPLAILGGVLFIIRYCWLRPPTWRVAHVNLAAILATLALGFALLLGAERFGWTTWAVTNRFLGWFVLLAYATTGALIVRDAHKEGFGLLLLTFSGATAAIAGIETILILLTNVGINAPVVPSNAEGFSLNHNFFAFQLLMALAAAMCVIRGFPLRITIFAVLLVGLWFAGSRSGWIATLALLGTALYVRVVSLREILIASACAVGTALLAALLPDIIHTVSGVVVAKNVPAIVPSAASTEERMISILGGLRLFVEHPIFGAGLGAFRNQMIFVSSPQPLLIHSTAVWLLAELGIVGFLVFAVPATYAFASEWVHARKEQASALIILCLVAFAVMATPADMLYQRTFWLLVGAGLAVVRRD